MSVYAYTNVNRISIRLTDDVIYELYYFLASEDPPRRPRIGRNFGPTGSLGWIRLSHVCRQWRHVGIDLAPLWAHIVCAFPPNIIETILYRAQNVPIDVDMSYYNGSDALWAIQKLPITRSRAYKDGWYHNERAMSWHTLFAGRTYPFLEELALENVRPEEEEGEALNAPALRALTTCIPRLIVAPSLRSLDCTSGACWDWRILLNFIQSYPLLDTLAVSKLSIDFAWEDEDDSAWRALARKFKRTSPPTLVRLSNLKTLRIEEYGPESREFLERLDLPVCTTLRINTEDDGENWEQILSRPEMSYPVRRALSIRKEWDFDTDTSNWELSLTESGVLTSPSYDAPGVCGTVSTWAEGIADLLGAVPDAVASAIQELAIVHACDMDNEYPCLCPPMHADNEHWTYALARFSGVTVLHFSNLFHDVLFDPMAKSSVLFPGLHTVVIEASGFDGQTRDSLWSGLYELLAVRSAAGSPIARLVVRGNTLCHRACLGHERLEGCRRLEGYRLSDNDDDDDEIAEAIYNQMAAACLLRRRITLERERELVDEVADERVIKDCSCEYACKEREGRFKEF